MMHMRETSQQAATQVLQPLDKVLPYPLSKFVKEVANHLSTDEYNVLTQLITTAAACLGPGINVFVSVLHSLHTKNGLRPWIITAAPSGSNKSGPFAMISAALVAALQQLHDAGMPGIYPEHQEGVGLIDQSRNLTGRFQQLQNRHDYTMLVNMEEGSKMNEYSSSGAASSTPDARPTMLTWRDGSSWGFATNEPMRSLKFTNVTMNIMVQSGYILSWFADNKDGLFNRFLVFLTAPNFEPLSVAASSTSAQLVEAWVDSDRVNMYKDRLVSSAKKKDVALCMGTQPSQLESQLEETEFFTADEQGDEHSGNQQDSDKERPINNMLDAMLIELFKDLYQYGHAVRDGIPKFVQRSFYLGTKQDVAEAEAEASAGSSAATSSAGTSSAGSSAPGKADKQGSAYAEYMTYYNQVQSILAELFKSGKLHLCGPISKTKLTVLELSAVIHIINWMLQYPIMRPTDAEVEAGWRRNEPSVVIDAAATRAAVQLAKISTEQLIVVCPQFSPLAATPSYQHLKTRVEEAGNGSLVREEESRSGSSQTYQYDNESDKKMIKQLLSANKLKGVMAHSRLDVSKARVYRLESNPAIDKAFLLASGSGGAPKFGTLLNLGDNNAITAATKFVKLEPTNNDELAALVSRLQMVDVSPALYFSKQAVQKMRALQIDISAFEDETRDQGSEAAGGEQGARAAAV